MRNVVFIFSCAILISCEKPYNKNVVNVHAYDVLTDEGLEGVYVAVNKIPVGDLGNTKIAADGYTDINGNLLKFVGVYVHKPHEVTRNF